MLKFDAHLAQLSHTGLHTLCPPAVLIGQEVHVGTREQDLTLDQGYHHSVWQL